MPTPNTGIPYVPEGTLDPAAGLNDALRVIDALLQCAVLAIQNDPPVTPADGDQYIVATGTGAWVGEDDNLAQWVAEGAFWQFYEAGTQVRLALNLDDGALYSYDAGWSLVAGLADAPSDGTIYGRQNATWVAAGGGGGSGDVVGPATSTDSRPALFDGTTGKLLKEAATTLGTAAFTAATDYATAAQGTTADSAVQPGDAATTLNMATARLLGRSTASAGAVEEITLGTNLSFTGTTLNAAGGGGGSGDVVGPASSVDNTLPRFDSTTGKLLQGSGVAITDLDAISGYKGDINAQTGTTYTLLASDTGKVVECTNAAAITVTLPNTLTVGFCCTIVQGGAGQITISPAGGATLRNRQSHTKTAGQWSGATLYVRTNAGSAAEYVLNGDTST